MKSAQVVEQDLKGYAVPDTIWGWYQLRLANDDGGRKDKAPSTHDHLETLRRYAKECDHVTEFGVRYVVSTWAFLAGKIKKMVSVDIRDCPVEPVEECCSREGVDFEFILGDTLEIEIEPTDLLFMDSLHTYFQVEDELARHASKVGKYIIVHSTSFLGVKRAIVEFLYNNSSWELWEAIPDTVQYGLVVIKRRS